MGVFRDAIRPAVNATISRLVAGVVLATALAGCTTADFTPYAGAQQHWPTASGSFVNSNYKIPVYMGPPNRPYIVLGYIDTEAPYGLLNRHQSITEAVDESVKRGADAIVLLTSGVNTVGSATFGSAQWDSSTTTTGGLYGNYFNAQSRTTGNASGSSFTAPIRRGYARAIAIKFLRP